MVAAARAAATRRAVINDPFAEPLVRSVGLGFLTDIATGKADFADLGAGIGFDRLTDFFAARTRFFDDFFSAATATGIHQVVIVASGLDSRAYRLRWPDRTTVYEVDQPEVIDFKTTTMAKLNADPAADHRTVGIDLRQDWPTALRRAGFDSTQPTAWIAEGLMIGYLPPAAEEHLLDNITALSSPGSRFAADYGSLRGQSEESQRQMDAFTDSWRHNGIDIDTTNLTYAGDHTNVAKYLQARGWETVVATLADLFAGAGLPPLRRDDLGPVPASIRCVTGIRN
jgi:methyltransferase (TIGR00027 family)